MSHVAAGPIHASVETARHCMGFPRPIAPEQGWLLRPQSRPGQSLPPAAAAGSRCRGGRVRRRGEGFGRSHVWGQPVLWVPLTDMRCIEHTAAGGCMLARNCAGRRSTAVWQPCRRTRHTAAGRTLAPNPKPPHQQTRSGQLTRRRGSGHQHRASSPGSTSRWAAPLPVGQVGARAAN